MKLVYVAHSKHYFYFTRHITKFILENNCVPLNPFMIHDYFLLDSVERETIRESNNELVRRADELWVFGPVSDGVLEEIKLANKLLKPIRYFEIIRSRDIAEISKEEVKFEENLEQFRIHL
jgi:uncharacterized phage-associated protein